MESEQLLDILGNQNRRKILQLLASRPCYMSEIADRLDVGAKAILGHLGLLEKAGLIEAIVDDQRRKYFHITDNLRLEVFVSPYAFETQVTTICTPDTDHNKTTSADLKTLYAMIQKHLERRKQILQEYQEVQANITEIMRQCMHIIERVAEDSIEAEIFYMLLKGPMTKRDLSMQLEIPEYVLEEYLQRMKLKQLIKKEKDSYSIG